MLSIKVSFMLKTGRQTEYTKIVRSRKCSIEKKSNFTKEKASRGRKALPKGNQQKVNQIKSFGA